MQENRSDFDAGARPKRKPHCQRNDHSDSHESHRPADAVNTPSRVISAPLVAAATHLHASRYRWSGDAAPLDTAGTQCGAEFIGELLQFTGVDVTDGHQIEALFAPPQDIESLYRLRSRCERRRSQRLRHEQVDDVRASLVDDCRNGLAVDVVETTAEERKAFRRKVGNWRSDVEPAIEPRLDRVTARNPG